MNGNSGYNGSSAYLTGKSGAEGRLPDPSVWTRRVL